MSNHNMINSKWNNYFIAGSIQLINEPKFQPPFDRFWYTPVQLRKIFDEKKWDRVVAHQTRNVPHTGHEWLMKGAWFSANGDLSVEKLKTGILVSCIIGPKRVGDFIDEAVLGAVGEIKNVNTELLHLLLEKGICPVLTPISITECGRKLNVNADMAAGAVAKALNAEMCLFVTDVKGVLKEDKILEKLTEPQTQDLINEGSIYGGMIPKVKTALSVLEKGINEVMIVSGKDCFFNNEQFIGTKFVSEEEVLQ